MSKQIIKPVATRLTMIELAKCRDGLLAKNIPEDQLQTTSEILKLAVYYMILNCKDPKGPPSTSSINFIKQQWRQTKLTKNLSLDELSE